MITIVSGLPRSATLMMQILVAGGMSPLSDGERAADPDNRRGCLEWERIKLLPNDPGCIAEAEGKVVKVISRLLLSVPMDHDYRVIFMERPLSEVLASQDQMMRPRGTYKDSANPAAMAAAFEQHLREVDAWLEGKAYVRSMRVAYHDALNEPELIRGEDWRVFWDSSRCGAMTQQVDASLYRNRTSWERFCVAARAMMRLGRY